METTVEQIECITDMAKTPKKRTVGKPKTAKSKPRILRSRTPPRLKRRKK